MRVVTDNIYTNIASNVLTMQLEGIALVVDRLRRGIKRQLRISSLLLEVDIDLLNLSIVGICYSQSVDITSGLIGRCNHIGLCLFCTRGFGANSEIANKDVLSNFSRGTTMTINDNPLYGFIKSRELQISSQFTD